MAKDRSFADILKEIRQDNNWTQAELAKKLKTSKQVISRYENGQRAPKITTVADYAKRLNVSMEYLMGVESKDAKKLATALREGNFAVVEKLTGIPPGSILTFGDSNDLEPSEMDIDISEIFDFFNKYKDHLSPEQQKKMLDNLNSIRKNYMDYKILEKKYQNYHKNAQVLDKLVDLLSSSSPETQEKILQIIEIMAKEDPPTSD